jgi:hypothetical protein
MLLERLNDDHHAILSIDETTPPFRLVRVDGDRATTVGLYPSRAEAMLAWYSAMPGVEPWQVAILASRLRNGPRGVEAPEPPEPPTDDDEANQRRCAQVMELMPR